MELNLNNLPLELVDLILFYSEIEEIIKFSLLNKKCKGIIERDSLWKALVYRDLSEIDMAKRFPEGLSFKEIYKYFYNWFFDKSLLEPNLFLLLSHDGCICSREDPLFQATNPSIKTRHYFTPKRYYFEVTMTNLGSWVSIGVSEDSFLVGSQSFVGGLGGIGFHVGYYHDEYQSNIKFRGNKKEECKKLFVGDTVSIVVLEKSIHFFWNGNFQYTLKLDSVSPLNSNLILRPTISLGKNSSITISKKYKKTVQSYIRLHNL